MNNSKYKLTKEEIEIESNSMNLIKISDKKRKRIEEIIDTTKKNRAISLRIRNYDLEKIKEKASIEGIPYQTLITTILHKYVTQQLFDKDEMIKTIKLLKEQKAI